MRLVPGTEEEFEQESRDFEEIRVPSVFSSISRLVLWIRSTWI